MPESSLDVLVDEAVHIAHPDYVALVLVDSGVRNRPTDAASDALLTDAETTLRTSRSQRPADHPHIAAWRAAFSAFGAKPSRTQLTEATTRAFFVFDRLDGLPLDDLHRAADELAALLLERWPAATLARIQRTPTEGSSA
jgi:DNA/RNA-binding domain of Phe-tRNA-synthetase-like protein